MEDLNNKEKIKLINHQDKIANIIKIAGFGSLIFLLIICLIPMGLIPSKRRNRISNPDLSILESMGATPTIIMILTISGSLVLYLLYSYKYLKISKDLIDLKKITLDVTIKNIIYKESSAFGEPKEIDIYFAPAYKSVNKIEFIGSKDFPILSKNQEVEITVTKNALFPIMIKPKSSLNKAEILNEVTDVKDVIKLLKNLKENKD